MGETWTNEQKQAISTRGKNILVSAAAGSGKTAVLVARIIEQVLSGETDIDRLLVVTFTNAAAEEMRQRIAKALAKAAEENPADQRIARQQILLSNASISTIHSFCQSVIRRNFARLDLDPKFRLAGEQEITLLKQDVMEELFEEEYAAADGDFLQFVDHYGDEHGDEKLHGVVNRLYNHSQSQPFPQEWLEKAAARFLVNDLNALESSDWLTEIRRQIKNKLSEALMMYEYLTEKAFELGGEGYLPTLEAEKDMLQKLADMADTATWNELWAMFSSAKFGTLRGKFEGEDAAKKYIQGIRKEVKDIIDELRNMYFSQDADQMLEDIMTTAPIVKTVCRLTQRFAEKYQALKLERTILDFNDLEHYAFAVLRDDAGTDAPYNSANSRFVETLTEEKNALHFSDSRRYKPSAAAEALREKFVEVIVDEYQDTNAIQDAILSLVMREDKPSSFVVGDVKQSIYGFRMADSEIFQNKYDTYNKLGEKYCRIELSKNFRSRESVLAGINYVFRQVMEKEAMELAYDDAAALYPGAIFPETEGNRLSDAIELDIIDSSASAKEDGAGNDELKGFEAEAVHIADRIRQLVNGKQSTLVYDAKDGGYRPIRWRDIVILLRSPKGKANIINDALQAQGIPAYATDDGGFFEETEIKVIVSLLNIIDNVRQDIPLAAVLYSVIGGFSAAELAEIRLNTPNDELYTALLKANEPEAKITKKIKEKTDKFLSKLSKWRDLAKQKSVPELIWQLYRDTGYYEYVGSMPGGLQRQANLRMLISRAEEYEKTDFRGLFRFLRFIERMYAGESELASAATLGENEDVVRIMSIHKSKGLEFPVVILADIDKKFNTQDAHDMFLIDRRMGIGPYCTPDIDFRYSTVARQALEARIVRAAKAEELRVLYVALTRAKEKLILIGKERWLDKQIDRWCRQLGRKEEILPGYSINAANSYLDWIGMTVARHVDGRPIRERALFAADYKPETWADSSQWKISIIARGDITADKKEAESEEGFLPAIRQQQLLPATEAKGLVERILSWEYDYKGLQDVPAKLSITEIKHRFGQQEDIPVMLIKREENVFRRPEFVRREKIISGSEYGTIMHTVLQHIDFQREASDAEIDRQLVEMVSREIITPKEKDVVEVSCLQRFFVSMVGQRMKNAVRVWRELPFSKMLPAKRYFDIKDETAEIFCQGVIDLLIEENDGLVLIDYKTDKETEPQKVREKHTLQINLYTEAVETILKKKVKEKYLFMLRDGSFVQIE